MRIVEGIIKFEYDADAVEDMSDSETLQHFLEVMVDDLIDYSYSDLAPLIEMNFRDN